MPTVNGKKYPYTPAGKAAAKKAASKSSYVGNVFKEVKQTAKRVSNAVDKADKAAYEKKYGRKMDVKIGSSKIKEQVGQLAGAVLQGRRYDDKTGKQIMTGKATSARPRNSVMNQRPATRPTTPRGTTTPKSTVIGSRPRGATPAPKRVGGAVGTRTEVPKKIKTFKATSTSTPQLPKSTKNLGKVTKKAYK